jgi:hypothetical protein
MLKQFVGDGPVQVVVQGRSLLWPLTSSSLVVADGGRRRAVSINYHLIFLRVAVRESSIV